MDFSSRTFMPKEAIEYLRNTIPELDIYLEKGQIEIILYKDWHSGAESPDPEKTIKNWVGKADYALANGYDGLRLVQDTSWLKNDWKSLIGYEEKLDLAIENRRIIALCTYPSGKFDTGETIHAALNHQFVLVKKEGNWEKVENPRLKKTEKRTNQFSREAETELKEKNEGLEKLLEEKTVELEKTSESLKESEKCLSQTQKIAHIGNWNWNIVTGELYWSDEVYRIFGRNPERFRATYDTFLSSIHPDDLEFLVNAIKKGFNGELQNIDYRIILPDGEERAVHTQAEIIFNEENRPVRAEGIVQDITESKRTEKVLQEREEQYRAFFENSMDAVLLASPDGTIDAANKAACETFGMTEEEIIRAGRNDILDQSDPRLKPSLEERDRTGRFKGEINHKRKDGTIFPGEVSTSLFRDKNGLTKIAIIIRDITERKRIEEALRKSEEHYRMLFTNMTEGFFLGEIICDRDGKPYDYRFLEINPAFELHTGVMGEQVLGRSHLEVFHKADPNVIEKYGLAALSGKPAHLEFFTHLTDRYLDIYVFSPEKGKFAAVFRDITERKKIEEKTRQRAEEIETVMEVAPVAIWISHDPQCHNITGNRMANEFYEAQSGENVSASSTPLWRFFQKGCELTAEELPMQKAAFKDIAVHNEEIDVLLQSGERKTLLGSASPLHDADGNVRGSVAASIDITQRKKAETELKETLDNLENLVKGRTEELEQAYSFLKESETKLAEAQKMAHIGNWDWDLVTNKIYASDEMCRIFGLDPQEFDASYEAFLNHVHPADQDDINAAYKAVLNGKELVGMDYRMVSADGQERVVHGQGEVTYNRENIQVRIRGTVQDITERKRTERALELSEERYRIIAEQTGQLVYDYNVEEDIANWAGNIEEITGYTPDKFRNMNLQFLLSCIHPEDEKMFLERYERFMNYGGTYRSEYRFKKDSGEYIYVEDQGVCLKDENGRVKRILGAVKDITERKKAEKALANIETARKREIHHRIKNNLQVISSLLDLQAEKLRNKKHAEDPEVLTAFRESQDRVMSIALIHEELHESKGTDKLDFSPYLKKLVKNLFQTYSVGNADLCLDMDLEDNIFFDIDVAVPLGLIVNEIVSNSLKYAFLDRDRGTIRIKLCREQNEELEYKKCKNRKEYSKSNARKEYSKSNATNFVLTVSDNGSGLPEEFNVEDSNTLGLQLVLILVDQLDGKLDLNRDSGTEFTIRFPEI
ncbi:PAS domain S-box protein [Methanosarcina hadiensis]|uniref:PAS domain S-box protein n=1 Tax=Methanosarcina hadiensis TaxID=3078083 RepID=UPI0039778A1E